MKRPSFDVLVLSDFKGWDANVVRDFLYSFNRHSRHRCYYMHAWTANRCRRLRYLDFDRFDAIVLFWDFYWIGCADPTSYCHVPSWAAERIANSSALKVQFLQDEYRDVHAANDSMRRFGANIMFSCVAPRDHETFYPKASIPSLKATYPVLTGYVPTYLEQVHWPATIARSIDIGYRSRKLPYWLGRLGQEKHEIALRFADLGKRHGFHTDISVREEDRLYGQDWLQFLRACRFSIGTESGASVVDFDGTIKKRCQQYLRQHPNADFEEVSAALFADVDGKTAVQTISPRLFEAAAFENTLILHEGRYEDMIKPDVHYISVKKDYSNVDEVVRRMKDRAFCAMLARNARKDLIDSKQYNYAAFVERFDTILESHVETPKARPTSRVVFYFLNYLHHDRLFPHEDKFLTIPKTCDAMDHCHALAPYLMSIAYSIQVVVGLMIAMPFLVERIGRGLLETPFGKLALFVRLLKDLRMLALARKARQGANAFSLQLAYRKDLRQMTLRSLPIAPSGSPITAARKPFDRSLVDDVLETEFTLAWDHQQAGCGIGLPHADSKTCIVYLNDDCIYRFESFQVLLQWLGSDKHRFFDGLLFDEEKTPTFAARLGGAVHVISTLAVLICWTAPVRCVRAIGALVWPTRKTNEAAAERPPLQRAA